MISIVNDLKRWTKERAEVKRFIRHFQLPDTAPITRKSYETERELLQDILHEEIEGIVVCDLHIPQERRDELRDLPLIPIHKEVTKESLSEPMKTYADIHDLLKAKQKGLFKKQFAIIKMLELNLNKIKFSCLSNNIAIE